MKKTIKKTLAVAMTAATLFTTSSMAMNVFAADNTETVQIASNSDVIYIEDHSVIDCVHRYKNSDGTFTFTIKLPKGRDLIYTSLAITRSYDGDVVYSTTILSNSKKMTYLYSDETSDYYDLKLSKYSDAGVGIKLYHNYFDQNICYMATDTSNGSNIEGSGYWLSA